MTRLYKLVVLTFCITVSLYSDSKIEPYLKYEWGESNYYVNNRNIANLQESKLVFPIKSSLIGLQYSYTAHDYAFILGYDTIIQNQKTDNGSDHDWHRGDLIVRSESSNTIKKNQTYYLTFSKPLNIKYINNFKIRYEQKKYHFSWSDTVQENLNTNTETSIIGETLTYSQDIRKISLSLLSNKEGSSFIYNIWLNYYDIESVDNHLLRNLVTTTQSSGFGYQLNLGYKYEFDKNSHLSILFDMERFKSGETDMKYYINGNYLTKYPSKVMIETNSISIVYSYSF